MIKRLLNSINWRVVLYSSVSCVVMVSLVLLMGFIGVKSDEQACTSVKIVVLGDESFIEQKDILAVLVEKYGDLEGRTLEKLPIHDMEQDLMQIPFVFSAMVTVDMDGSLTIGIKQREAVVRIINKNGPDFYIDKFGHKIPVSLKYVPRVPVVNGAISEPFNGSLDTIHNQVVKDIYQVAQFIGQDSMWDSQIVQLYVNEQQDIELVPRVGNQQIILGNADSLARKFERLRLFYSRVVPRTGIDAYKSVNLKYSGQLVCERRANFVMDSIITRDTVSNNSINTQQ